MVVYGKEKLDEITSVGPTAVCEFKDGWYKTYEITPGQFGFDTCTKEDLKGSTPVTNAEITRNILNGTDKGPKRNTVLMNAGAALYIADKAATLEEGVKMAAELIDSGKALETMERFISASNKQ